MSKIGWEREGKRDERINSCFFRWLDWLTCQHHRRMVHVSTDDKCRCLVSPFDAKCPVMFVIVVADRHRHHWRRLQNRRFHSTPVFCSWRALTVAPHLFFPPSSFSSRLAYSLLFLLLTVVHESVVLPPLKDLYIIFFFASWSHLLPLVVLVMLQTVPLFLSLPSPSLFSFVWFVRFTHRRYRDKYTPDERSTHGKARQWPSVHPRHPSFALSLSLPPW